MIKFHRPVFEMDQEVFAVDGVHELDKAVEDMFVRQNYAEYIHVPKDIEEGPSKLLKKSFKAKIDNSHKEGE